MSEYVVEMRNITKKFPKIIANDKVNIKIKKGEIFAILGENGAGKSTLMSMLFGIYEPDEGEIYLRGEKVNISSPNVATKLNIGMVHQHFKLVSNFTIAENIIMGCEPIKTKGFIFPFVNIKDSNDKIRQLSKKYGLEVDPTQKIEDINVSTQQRVEILKMLYREAEVLIFDEPTAVLTPQEIEFLLDIIVGLKKQGKTIILITHKLEEIKKIADRCAVLRRGKVVEIFNTYEKSTKEMANLMVGREVLFNLDKKEANFGKEVLNVKSVTVKNSDGFDVVKNVSFSIREGEVFAVAGVSGNGQVELADVIAGLIKAHGGKIELNGEDITNWTIRERTLKGISYVPEDRQTYGAILDFLVSENIVLKEYFSKDYCDGFVLKEEKFKKRAKELIEKYDIRCAKGADSVVRSLSGGNQQKIIIAREIELDSKLLIFVQPTRGLDIGAIESIHKRILEQRDKGKAILLISLELEEIMNCADTIGVIYNGEMLVVSEAKHLSSEKVGEFMMGVKN